MAHTGRKTYFELDGQDVSHYLDAVNGSNNTEEFDGTTFQPDVANPVKTTLYGFNDKRYALSGKWTAASEAFFSALDGAQDVDYVYGPIGHVTGSPTNPKIYGTCNVGKYSGPISQVNGVITFTVEVAVITQTSGAF